MSSLTLAFDDFGSECITMGAANEGQQPAEFVRASARRYLTGLPADRLADVVPSFCLVELDTAAMRIAVEMGEGELKAANVEARRQGVTVERLLEHAALCNLAAR